MATFWGSINYPMISKQNHGVFFFFQWIGGDNTNSDVKEFPSPMRQRRQLLHFEAFSHQRHMITCVIYNL